MNTQIAMTGEDWTSERDKKSHAKRVAAKKKTALDLARVLRAADTACHAFRRAHEDLHGFALPADDSRVLLSANMREYGHFLESVYDKP